MGSRFGAAVAKKNNTNLKFILGSFTIGLVLVLFVLVWSLQNHTEVVASNREQVPENIENSSNNIGVMVPMFRIEAGAKISDDMFKVNYLPENQVPAGAILNHNRGMLSDKYASKLIPANIVVSKEDISNSPPLSTIEIPLGYRLITILVDNQSGVDGFATPGSRVDMNWSFIEDGKKKLASPLVKFVKVVSVGGVSDQNSPEKRVQIQENKKITVSLLMTERQSQFIEVAKGTGSLSLTLVGGQEPPADLDALPRIIDIDDLIGVKPAATEEEQSSNILYTKEAVTGRTLKYELKKGKWIKDKNTM
jgi:Flp pilus assembly protein CpaB